MKKQNKLKFNEISLFSSFIEVYLEDKLINSRNLNENILKPTKRPTISPVRKYKKIDYFII